MRLLLSWVASSVLVIILPIYVPYIYDRIRADGWRAASKHIFFGLLVASGIFLLGWYGLTPNTAAAAKSVPRLEYLNKANLDEEVNLRKRARVIDGQALGRTLQVIKVKFDEAGYAQEKNDFDRALKLYEEIDRGSDENGPFYSFHSACILNNMAVAYFRKQGDRGFKASTVLFEALRLEPNPSP